MNRATGILARSLVAAAFACASFSAPAQVDLVERQYHWDLIYEYRFANADVRRLIGFCTDYDETVDSFLRKNMHIFEFSFMSVVQAYETHNFRWWEAIKSVFGPRAQGADRAGKLIDSAIWDKSPTEADLCDKLLWVHVMELEEVAQEMKKELDARRVEYVEPIGLVRVWKGKEDNPWYEVVEVPYFNLKKLFDGNPYKQESAATHD